MSLPARSATHKALRLYDLSGLVPPAHTDAVTGYRLQAVKRLDAPVGVREGSAP